MAESMMSPECARVEAEIVAAYQEHVVIFREFVTKVCQWLANYEQSMAPVIMQYLEDKGGRDAEANWQLVNDLTRHADAFAKLQNQSLSEYEEAYKTALAIFRKAK